MSTAKRVSEPFRSKHWVFLWDRISSREQLPIIYDMKYMVVGFGKYNVYGYIRLFERKSKRQMNRMFPKAEFERVPRGELNEFTEQRMKRSGHYATMERQCKHSTMKCKHYWQHKLLE